MPGMSGLELARRAREVDPAMAVIIMTGHASFENLQQAVRRGVADFLSKPFELEELRLAVDQALHKRQILQDNLRLRAVELLLHSSEAVNATLNQQELGQIILQMALLHAPCRTGFLTLTDHNRRLGEALSSSQTWALEEYGRMMTLQAYRRGQPVIIDGSEVLCSDGNQQIRRGMAMPLRAQNEVVGVLLLCDDRAEMLRTGTQEIITLLANQAGIALHNAHLYGRLQDTNQRLTEFDRLKSEFIAIASHELRTPLSIVLGYAMMVREESEGEQREYAGRVLESAQQIKEIVDDMVNLRHLEMQQTRLQLGQCDLRDLVQSAVERRAPMAQAKNHMVTTSLPDESVAFMADGEKVLLVLGHLLTNAMKFTPTGGTIQLTAAVWPRSTLLNAMSHGLVPADGLLPTSEPEGEFWVVWHVQDNGIGIAAKEVSRIFDRFYQVADSLTREQGGTGLGLAIVKELIELQGGTIWVASTEGRGSTFSFAIPYQSA
jgi:signal transduction histidine kinase